MEQEDQKNTSLTHNELEEKNDNNDTTIKSLETPHYPSNEISTVEKVEKIKKAKDIEEVLSPRNTYDEEIDNLDTAADELELTWFQSMMKNQDVQQSMTMIITCTFEFYRVIMSTLLTLFVPQSCGGAPCSVSEKMAPTDNFGTFVLVSNFITLGLFFIMYFIETKREWCLINYLDINRFKPRDNESVKEALKDLSERRELRIRDFDKNYKNAGYICMTAFTFNTLFSGIVVFNDFLDSKTFTVYLTNTLFMSTKLYDVYTIVDTKPYIFLSSYLSRKIQYNDVDPDKRESNTEVVLE